MTSLVHHVTNYQASVEPMRRPDHKAKKHARPDKWSERKRKIAQQLREYEAAGLDLAIIAICFPPLFVLADWLRYTA